ncbi:hypothetical protein AeNC1_017343 [Aphanomyces euteiches]|nr:hypothetical protein AeNC1_017343 [Aphanomyces euteiches]
MQQILNILIDDAGKDWKPRNKTVKPHTKQPHQNPPTRPTSAKPKAPIQKTTSQTPPTTQKSTPAAHRPVPKMNLSPAQQLEMQQILNILIDDAGKDWKPRNKSAPSVPKHQAPNKTAKEAAKPQTPKKAQDTPKRQTPTKQKQPTAKEQPTKAQAPKTHSTTQQQKAPPATAHIQANKNQRAKLSS